MKYSFLCLAYRRNFSFCPHAFYDSYTIAGSRESVSGKSELVTRRPFLKEDASVNRGV